MEAIEEAREAEVISDGEDFEQAGGEGGEAVDGEGGAAAAGGAGPPPKKQRRDSKSPAQWWAQVSTFPWVSKEPEDEEAFMRERILTCLWCDSSVSGKSKMNNALAHADGAEHKKKGDSYRSQPKIGSAFQQQQQQQAPPSQERVKKLRGVLALSAMGRTTKRGAVALFSDSNLRLASFLTTKAGSALGHPNTHSVVDAAYDTAYDLMMDMVRELTKDQPMSVLLDEGSTSFAGRARPLAITLCLTGMKPICLDLVWDYRRSYELPEDDDEEGWHPLLLLGRAMAPDQAGGGGAAPLAGGGAAPQAKAELPSVRMAKHVRSRLEYVGINIETQVTGVMSDSANLMTAIARELGLPRLECLAHMLHDVSEAASKPFKLYHLMTVGLSTVLTAGGGVNRDNALHNAGVAKSKCKCIRTRWGRVFQMADYLTGFEVDPAQPGKVPEDWKAPFETVRGVMKADVSFQLGKKKKGGAAAAAAAAAEALDDEDGVDDVDVRVDAGGRRKLKDVLADVKRAFEVDVLEANRLFYAPLEAAILRVMVPNINGIITKASANPDSLELSFLTDMAALKAELQGAARDRRQGLVLEKAYLVFYKDFTEKEKDDALKHYAPLILAGAQAALKVFEERVEPALARLQQRWRFDPKQEPKEVEVAGAQLKESDILRFFGVPKGQYNLSLESEWDSYRAKWPGMSARLKALGVGAFWADKEVHSWFPTGGLTQLVKLGRWYGTLPTSNVASERVFGVLRGLEDAQRKAANEETVTVEVLAQCNSWLVERVQERHGRW